MSITAVSNLNYISNASATTNASQASATTNTNKYSDEIFKNLVQEGDPIQSSPSLRAERKEVLRRLGPEALSKFVENSKHIELKMRDLHALRDLQWNDEIFQKENLQRLAMVAFIRGHIDCWTLSEILIYDECKAKKSIVCKDAKVLANVLSRSFFTEEEVATALKSEKPECRFYLRPFQSIQKADLDVLDVLLNMNKRFLVMERATYDLQVVIPPALMNKLYQVKYGSEACLANPTLGESKLTKNFKDPLKMDVLIPCSIPEFDEKTPKIADGFKAPPLEFYHHDLAYHLLLKNCVPLPHRNAMIALANMFEKIHFPNQAPIRELAVIQTLLDWEFTYYADFKEDATKSRSLIFWANLAECFEKIAERVTVLQLELAAGEAESPFRLALATIFHDRETWENMYGIDVNDVPRKNASQKSISEDLPWEQRMLEQSLNNHLERLSSYEILDAISLEQVKNVYAAAVKWKRKSEGMREDCLAM